MASTLSKKETSRCFYSLMFILALLTITGCYGDSSGEDTDQGNDVTPAVEAVKARFGSLPLTERLSGTVRAENQVNLSPEITGKIAQVFVRDGERVERGAPLVKLQDDQYSEQYQQAKAGANIAKAQLKQAQSELKRLQGQLGRIQSLRDRDLSSAQEFENIQSQVESSQANVDLTKAQLEQAQANMQEAQNLLARTTIRAPIAGTVGQRNAEIGMQVTSASALFVIGNLEQVTIEVVLTENMLSAINVGQKALAYMNQGTDNEKIVEATVARISPFLNNVTRSTEAEIEVENSKTLLKPGMFIPVDILYGDSRQATLIPTSALYTNPETGNEGVFVASSIGMEIEPADSIDPDNPPPLTEPTGVEFKEVNVIARGGMEIAVAGVESGSWVVTVGQNLLSAGRGTARVRTVDWEHIISMQQLQRQDLLQQVLNRQDGIQKSPS
jgi:RND family efflux transporter MFP subunit